MIVILSADRQAFNAIQKYMEGPKLLEILASAVIILSPFYIVRLNVFGLPTTLLEMILLATFAVWLWRRKSILPPANSLIRALARIKVLERSERFLSWPVVVLVLGAVIATIVSSDQTGALGILKAYFLEPILFFYLLIDLRVFQKGSDPKKRTCPSGRTLRFANGSDPMSSRQSLILGSLIITGLCLSIWGILQVVFGLGVVTPHEQLAGRAHGPFNSGNALALFLGPVFLLALGQLFAFRRGPLANTQGVPLRLVWQTGLVITTLAGIFLTKSQGGLIGLIGAMSLVGLIWLISKTRWRLWLKYLWFIVLIYLIIVTGGLTQISRVTPKNNNPWIRPINDTLTPRLCLWEGAVNLLRDHPFLGAGLNGFKSLYSQKYYTCDAEALQYPHNFTLNFWTELGILGVLGIFGLLMIFVQQQIKFYLNAKKTEGKMLALSLLAIVFYWLVHGLVDVPYFKNDLSLQFWVILALGVLSSVAVRYTDSSD